MTSMALLIIGALAAIPLSMSSTSSAQVKCPKCLQSFTRFDVKAHQFHDEYYCPKCNYEFKKRF